MPWAPSQGPDDTLRFIQATRRQLTANDGFQTVLVAKDNIVGVVGFHAVDWTNRITSLGYWLDEDHQGRGLITSSVRALVDHALRVWKLNRVEVRVAPENHRSRSVPERLGFREEGVLRQVERIEDCYRDSVVYAILAPDWPVWR
jgi:ribosomal-protein-serine acetyltransferase